MTSDNLFTMALIRSYGEGAKNSKRAHLSFLQPYKLLCHYCYYYYY